METLKDKVAYSIDLLKRGERLAKALNPTDGYIVGFSGGKDSQVLLDLVKKSVDLLQEMVVSSIPADVRTHFSSPEFALLMQNFVAGCGLNVMTVLQLVKKFENECAASKHSF